MELEKLFFNSTNSKFYNSDSMKSNNPTPTSAYVKKKSNSTLKYATMATPTQQYSFKQGCGVGVPGVASFRSESESQIGVGFLDSVKLEIGFLIAFGDFDLR